MASYLYEQPSPGCYISHHCLGLPTSQAQSRPFVSIPSSSFHATPRYVSYCPHFTDGNLEAPRSQASQEVELSLEYLPLCERNRLGLYSAQPSQLYMGNPTRLAPELSPEDCPRLCHVATPSKADLSQLPFCQVMAGRGAPEVSQASTTDMPSITVLSRGPLVMLGAMPAKGDSGAS